MRSLEDIHEFTLHVYDISPTEKKQLNENALEVLLQVISAKRTVSCETLQTDLFLTEDYFLDKINKETLVDLPKNFQMKTTTVKKIFSLRIHNNR